MRGVTSTLLSSAFEADRQSDIAMVKERVGLKDQFVSRKRRRGDADQRDLHDAEDRRHRHFAKVKTEAGRDVEVGIDVVDVVKAPEKRDAVVEHMPPVEAQVHEQKRDHELRRRGQRDDVKQAERLPPAQCIADLRRGPHERRGNPKASAEKQRFTTSRASNSDLVARSGTKRSTTKNSPNKPATTTRVSRAGIMAEIVFAKRFHTRPTVPCLTQHLASNSSSPPHQRLRRSPVSHGWTAHRSPPVLGHCASAIYNRAIAQPPPIASSNHTAT